MRPILSTRPRSCRSSPSPRMAAAVRVVSVMVAVAAGTPARAAAGVTALWDDARVLTPRARAGIERTLAAASDRAAVPLFVVVAERGRDGSASALAARAFEEHGLRSRLEHNPVLLAVVLRPPAAAVETGKGNAGIVPELDANRIRQRLASRLSARHPEEAISEAVMSLSASALATAVRRKPLPHDALDPAPDDSGAAAVEVRPGAPDAAAPDPEDGGATSVGPDPARDAGLPADATGRGSEGPPSRRSRLPLATGVGVVVLLALALRRRRQNAAGRGGEKDPPARRF